MEAQIQYHRNAINLLPKAPRFSVSAAESLAKRESRLGIHFPASVREWYSLDGAVDLLSAYSNSDHPREIDELGKPFENWYGRGPRDFLSDNLLVFMHENQGVCNWAIKLNGSADPPVVVEVDTGEAPVWLPCADRFSTFIWSQIWDRIGPCDSLAAFAQETQLSAADLDFLRSSFRPLPATTGWPGKMNYRFENDDGCILIWDGQGRGGVDWSVSGRTAAGLEKILAKIWRCGTLSESLYAGDDEAEEVLRRLRNLGTSS